MPIIITTALRNWLTENGLQGFIQVAEAPPHPNATEIASRINIATITDSMLRKKLNLDCTGERQIEMVPAHILERYYGKYSLSAKAFRTKDIPDPFFRDVAKFLLEVGCVHVNAYGMPKHKAGVVLATYEGTKVDWGTVAGAALREGLSTFQDGKKLRPIISQYLTILFPPRSLPAPPNRPSKRRLEELAASTWEDDSTATAQRSPSPPQRRRSPTPPPRQRSPTPPPQRQRSPPPQNEAEEQQASPRPKKRRLDRKNGQGLAKDTTKPVTTLISESYEEVVFTGDTTRGKGPLIPTNEIMAYPDIPDVAHEFAARLRFGTTFELMQFLAQQQLTLTERMAEEHADMQMIQRALAGSVDRTEERALGKIGRLRNADEGRIGIELPPLNTALVEVHRELATVRHGAKDMVTRTKHLKRREKYANGQLAEAQKRISELEEQLRAQPAAQPPQVTSTPEELRNLETALAKAQKAADTAEIEIGRLRDELRQSSDRETNVRAQARKAVKDAQDKLQDEVAAHKRTMDAISKHIEREAHAESKILELREEARKQQQWFDDHLASREELAKQAEQILKKQMAGMEEHHQQEKKLWEGIKTQYEVRAQGHTAKIKTLKTSLDELRAKTDMGTARVRTLLHTHRTNFEKALTDALANGWAGWAQQAAELHTFRADQENRAKEGKGFFKLDNDSIATVREDLAKDYQALADQHLEEVTQILDAYAAAEEELGHQIQATETDRLATGQQAVETVELPDSPPEDGVLLPQEAPTDVTPETPASEPPLTGTLASEPNTVTNTPDATPAAPRVTPPHEEHTPQQPATKEPTTEQTDAPAEHTTGQNSTEPPVAPEPDAPPTELHPDPTISIDPISEPSILDIFDDA